MWSLTVEIKSRLISRHIVGLETMVLQAERRPYRRENETGGPERRGRGTGRELSLGPPAPFTKGRRTMEELQHMEEQHMVILSGDVYQYLDDDPTKDPNVHRCWDCEIDVRETDAWIEDHTMRTVDVSLCDEQGTPVVSWHVARAVPVKLSAPPFDVNTNDVSIESLELLAAGISVEHH